MTAEIDLPEALAPWTCGERRVLVRGATVREAIRALDGRFPGLGARLFDADGNLRRFIRIESDGQDIRLLDHLETALGSEGRLTIRAALPALASGWA